MIGRLRGTYEGVAENGAVLIDVAGIGYLVRVPPATMEVLVRNPSSVTILTHMAVREDAMDLYGFATEDELSFFKLLLEVSGIGPKSALGILGLAGIETLRSAIAAGDASYLTRVSGIGKKSAERIVVELKDKLAKQGYGEGHTGKGGDGDVFAALTQLGYSVEESRAALRQLPETATDLQSRIREALRILSA